MKYVVGYVLVGVGFCLWSLTKLLRNEAQQMAISQQIGNKGTGRAFVVIALLCGLFWPFLLTVRMLSLLLPWRWFFTKDHDDDDPPPPNQEQGAS